ncbi:MAG: hypothetical protein A3J62_01995 [Candidatus Buchananbacteria bacterium RIFCSPHIGHO2_02_FULL_38_8]|uniref:Uncharacterized protein n=1 Tax=Candidatus Buchananbacteria bacterium RIFCSPHIGHO2_02_FULL_38_8 TaxID=1797538 RepID=A0A1G1Y393_9BACT|nr:MAG: hypothetical protein A3J62_01995 [Candidatus Buchananbacteria bacterium RIFCSPHIGHO2_02_FULL_38_8]
MRVGINEEPGLVIWGLNNSNPVKEESPGLSQCNGDGYWYISSEAWGDCPFKVYSYDPNNIKESEGSFLEPGSYTVTVKAYINDQEIGNSATFKIGFINFVSPQAGQTYNNPQILKVQIAGNPVIVFYGLNGSEEKGDTELVPFLDDGYWYIPPEELNNPGKIQFQPGVNTIKVIVQTGEFDTQEESIQVTYVLPVISNVRATNITYNSSTVKFHVEGRTLTNPSVVYGMTTAYGNSAPSILTNVTATGFDGTAVLSRLSDNTTYHFKIVLDLGTDMEFSDNKDYTFTTPIFISGACIVDNCSMGNQLPNYNSPDVGDCYAKIHIPGVNVVGAFLNPAPGTLRYECTKEKYDMLTPQLCAVNVTPYTYGVITFNPDGTWASIGGPNKTPGSGLDNEQHQCPPTGVCLIRNSSTSVPNYFSPDLGSGYAKISLPGVNDLATLKQKCTDENDDPNENIYQSLMNEYCTSTSTSGITPSPVQRQVVIYKSDGSHDQSTCDDSGCDFVSCP